MATRAADKDAGQPGRSRQPRQSRQSRQPRCAGAPARNGRTPPPGSPAPSVELLLHAFMPAKFIDHTHASAVLSIIDQPDGEKKCADVFGGRLAFVPYLMPGFGLAKKAIGVAEQLRGEDGVKTACDALEALYAKTRQGPPLAR